MLNIVITGAGIAGLASAISLRRAGHTVSIYERSSLKNEVGAAIGVPPNAARFLLAWGLDPQEYKFVRFKRLSFHDSTTLEQTALVNDGGSAAAIGGVDQYLAYRVDLHNALKHLATRQEGIGKPVVIHSGSEIVAYNPSIPSITLKGGQEIEADIVIGADGVHSIAVEAVLSRKNEPEPPRYANYCYRFLIPVETLEADPETRFWNEDFDGAIRLIIDEAGQRRLVVYACRDNTLHNFVCLFRDEKIAKGEEDFQKQVDISTILKRYAGYDEKILKIISKAKDATQWPLYYRPPVETWRKDYLTLVGDAAHPMLPNQAQGGAQGMEDGLAIGIALCGATTKEDIVERLDIYEQIRRPRASVIQVMSNVGQDQVGLVKDEVAKYLPADQAPTNLKQAQILLFGYNIVDDMTKAMTKHDPDFALPDGFFEKEVIGAPAQNGGGQH